MSVKKDEIFQNDDDSLIKTWKPLTANEINDAYVSGKMSIEKAIAEIEMTLQEMQYSINEGFNNKILTIPSKSLISPIIEIAWRCRDIKEDSDEIEQYLSLTPYSRANGYSVESLMLLKIKLKEELAILFHTPEYKNRMINEGIMTTKELKKALQDEEMTEERALLIAEFTIKKIDEAAKNSIQWEKQEYGEGYRVLAQYYDKDHLEAFYHDFSHRFMANMIWNNTHNKKLVADYMQLIKRTPYSFDEVINLMEMITNLKRKIAEKHGDPIRDTLKQRTGKTALEIRKGLARGELTIRQAYGEVQATILDIDNEFMGVYKNNFNGGYNTVEGYENIIARRQNKIPCDEIDEICDEDNMESTLEDLQKMSYTLGEIDELLELRQECQDQIEKGETISPEGKETIPNTAQINPIENNHERKEQKLEEHIKHDPQYSFAIEAGYVKALPSGKYQVYMSIGKYFDFMLNEHPNTPISAAALVGNIIKRNGEAYTRGGLEMALKRARKR